MIERIEADVREAMKARDAQRRDALRLVLSALKSAEKDARAPLDEQAAITVLKREHKRRREAAEGFRSGGATVRAEAEDYEAALIESYLPEELPEPALVAIVDAAIASVGATTMQQMGAVMKEAMAAAAGRADGKRVQALVRERLG